MQNALDRPSFSETKDNRARGIPLPQLLPPHSCLSRLIRVPYVQTSSERGRHFSPPSYRLGKEYPEYKFWFPEDNRKLTKQSAMVQVLAPLQPSHGCAARYRLPLPQKPPFSLQSRP